MNLDVDSLIKFFDKNTVTKFPEIDEQETGGASTGSAGKGGKAVPKWADSYPMKRGKANMLGKSGEKWETGLTRGAANQIW